MLHPTKLLTQVSKIYTYSDKQSSKHNFSIIIEYEYYNYGYSVIKIIIIIAVLMFSIILYDFMGQEVGSQY